MFLVALNVLFLLSTTTHAQSPMSDAAANKAKAETILRRGVDLLGGAAYTSVRTIAGRGLFTPYEAGAPGDPYRFEDYIAYPDKNRTDFRGRGNYIIQTNTGEAGWLFDAAARKIDAAKPEQLQDYNLALRTSIDGLLRGAWRTPGKNQAELSYVGRREASLAQRNEAVRLTYADGFMVDFEFSAREGFPAKVIYKRTRKVENKEGVEEPVEVTEEDRFAQFIETNGVRLPFVIDHYRGGIQTSRVNYQSVTFNEPLPDDFFQRPANIKALTERKKQGRGKQ